MTSIIFQGRPISLSVTCKIMWVMFGDSQGDCIVARALNLQPRGQTFESSWGHLPYFVLVCFD